MPAPRRATVRIASYAPPAYPTRREADPALLLRHVPPRWRGNRVLLLLLAGTAPATGCREPAAGVAPVAVYGEGTGSFGCMMMVPPVYLSEAEVAAVVRDELAASGVSGVAEGKVLDDVRVAPIRRWACEGTYDGPEWKDPFEADFYVGRDQVAIEVLSEEDHEDLVTEAGGCGSSVYVFNLRALARHLCDGLAEAGAGRWYGVLYDPLVEPSDAEIDECLGSEDDWSCMDAANAAAQDESRAILREQVADVVAWMRDRGLL